MGADVPVEMSMEELDTAVAFVLEEPLATCDPSSWTGYDGVTCGDCAALVDVRDNGGSCSRFCELQGLACLTAWDDTTGDECSLDAPQLGCDYVFDSTSDGVCVCSGAAAQHPVKMMTIDTGFDTFKVSLAARSAGPCRAHTVSYTHLTLPTICSV